ncbi:MAG: hypothetical protein M1833_004734 [Piccolia ochrophora]|nr:MAG: hypothetical protein M1833_004734 [Piccolia ochrophora]
MSHLKPVRYHLPLLSRTFRPLAPNNSPQHRKWSRASVRAGRALPHRPLVLILGAVLAAGAGITITTGSPTFGFNRLYAEAAEDARPVSKSLKRKKGVSKEEQRDLISSQHLQVKKSWENPGVYAWGSNSGRVVAPEVEEPVIKSPRRFPYFDGLLLRDLKLSQRAGAAITSNGDLLQWGVDHSEASTQPTATLTGKSLIRLALSRDRIVALSSKGKVYSIPISKAEQTSGPRPWESSWLPFWSVRSPVSYRILQPSNLSWGEQVVDISGGLEHVLLLTSAGRLYSAASASDQFPSRGQTGIPGLTWGTRPEGPYDQCHEITTLRGFGIKKIATGDLHSLALDSEGRLFTFGDNSVGQLGFDYNPEAVTIDAPSLLSTQRLYAGTNLKPRVTNVAAGGMNSFFTVDATRVAGQGEDVSQQHSLGRVTADAFSCGQGIRGTLGNGRWSHVQGTPTKIKALSGLFEYDEKLAKVIPIRLAQLSVGESHACATMDNVTHLEATASSSKHDTNWGADILWWGGNEYYQLGTGRRNNVSNPTYIPPLDTEAEKEVGRKEENRFQITPRKTVEVNGKRVSMEQRVECGRNLSAVYSGT